MLTLLIESVFRLPSSGRLILLLVGAVLIGGPLVWYTVRPLLGAPGIERLALRLEERFPEFRDRLIGTLQLWGRHDANPEGYSLAMIDAAAVESEEVATRLNFREIINVKRCWKAAESASGLIALCVLLLLFFPAPFQSSLTRVTHPFTDFPRPQRTFIVVSPGDTEAVSEEDVVISVRVTGEIPDEVVLRSADVGHENWKTYPFVRESDREYSYVVQRIKRSLHYSVEAGDAESPLHTITVLDRPMVRRLKLRYTYPAYTRLGAREEEDNIGDIRAMVGTSVQMDIVANKTLDSARVGMSGGQQIEATLRGREARAAFVIRRGGKYHIELRDKSGLRNKDPIEYRITASSDEYPVVRIIRPGTDTELAEDMLLPLAINATDDFGFSRLQLAFTVGEDGALQERTIPMPKGAGSEMTVEHMWDLADLDLLPEDVVFYRVAVYDNDTVSGPKRSESRTFMVRFPSIYEIYAEVERSQEEQMVDLEEMLRESRDVKEKLDQVVRELQRETELDWEKQKETDGALQRQREMAEDLKKLSEEMERSAEKLERHNLVTPETLEKLEEIQRLMQEITTPELMEALEKLHQALQQIDRQQLQQAMKDFSFNQEDFQKRLERTIELLKRIQMEQKMDALVKKMDELLERQEDLNRSTESADELQDMSDLAAQQEKMRRDLDRLKQTMQAQATQKRISDLLRQMSQGLRMAQSMMMQNMFQQVLEAMRKATHQLLDLSQQQEGLSCQTEGLRRNSPQCEAMAEKQLDAFNNAAKVANALFDAARQSLFITQEISRSMGKAMAEMEDAINSLEGRNTSSAAKGQREAMSALNEAVMQMRQAMQNMCSSGQCSGGMQQFLQRLQQLAQQQMCLNQETMGLDQMGQWSLEDRAALQRLAAEQEMLRKSIEELQREMGNRPEILGRLDRVIEDMKKVSEELKGQQLSQETIARQNRILSRLLDYQRSLRERDYTRQRRAKPGKEYLRTGPAHLPEDLGERQDELRQDLLDALKEDYPKEYKDLIRAYFEALSKEQEGPGSEL
ncbi:hypothetical protein AMJ82_12370 [candidate division TA06 bacterium SM23_40]|uniref:DUF4175 domain-containing protein n=1 Tax=candidate division TA06 bacterium SM23_40 TaxID=1703774 RepID=A0A0S8FY71_UNCT6|nr:MAG: hypothetical protein AMJ82_12370 [candidate division TA06 bacterium SM23_40]